MDGAFELDASTRSSASGGYNTINYKTDFWSSGLDSSNVNPLLENINIIIIAVVAVVVVFFVVRAK